MGRSVWVPEPATWVKTLVAIFDGCAEQPIDISPGIVVERGRIGFTSEHDLLCTSATDQS
jgi:hypothetical protein